MQENIDIRKGRYCVFMLHTHLVFVTKYRRNIFSKAILDDLNIIFESVCKDFNAELVEFDGEQDHVHLFIHLKSSNNIFNSNKHLFKPWRLISTI
jgi:putative transposase